MNEIAGNLLLKAIRKNLEKILGLRLQKYHLITKTTTKIEVVATVEIPIEFLPLQNVQPNPSASKVKKNWEIGKMNRISPAVSRN